ncbi:MAG: cytochrome c3 family protein [Gemmatimonadaceae bacterium]
MMIRALFLLLMHHPGSDAHSASVATLKMPAPVVLQAPVQLGQPTDSTFKHSIHKNLECTQCHGTTSTHGEIKISAPGGCLGCHHSAEQKTQCLTCHKEQTLTSYSVPVTFAISARRDPVVRPLSFAHTRHSSLECTQCHGADTKRTVTTTCSTCHSNHHVVTNDCAGCHANAKVGHDRSAHAGCAKCHTDPVVNALPAVRNVCITCHQDKRNHYPTGECATCHALDKNGMMSAGKPGAGK